MSSVEGGAKCRVVPRPHNVRLEELPSLAVVPAAGVVYEGVNRLPGVRFAPPVQEGWLRGQEKPRKRPKPRRRGGCSKLTFEQPPRRFAPPLLSRRGNTRAWQSFHTFHNRPYSREETPW